MADHCEDCVRGTLHEGTPRGETTVVEGVDVYFTIPQEGKYDKEAAVLFLGDVFGLYDNAKLLVDGFADAGFATYFPDYLNKDAIPIDAMKKGTFDMDEWRTRHTPAETRPPLDKVIADLKKKGIKKFFSTGYCFGGKYTVDLAIENAVVASVAAHPAGIKVPQDLDTLVEKSRVPLLINACETDGTWPKETQAKAEEILGSGKYKPGWKQNYYAGCTHGFATRGDISVPEIKHGKEDSFRQTVEWFRKHSE